MLNGGAQHDVVVEVAIGLADIFQHADGFVGMFVLYEVRGDIGIMALQRCGTEQAAGKEQQAGIGAGIVGGIVAVEGILEVSPGGEQLVEAVDVLQVDAAYEGW